MQKELIMTEQEKQAKYLAAKDRVDALRKFYGNLVSYLIFIGFLAALNYYIDGWRHPWFLWAAFGWGLGLIFQAIGTFQLNPFFGKGWEDKKIRELMEKEEKEKRWR